MPLSAAERMSFAIQCPRCGKVTEKPVAWLATFGELPCITPGCGHLIDLKATKNRGLIEKLYEQCANLDALLSNP